ncbi:MAG: thioesterase family protein [Anaerolineae bacterium]
MRYLAEVHIGDTVTVRMRLMGRSARRIHYMNFMVNETQQALASTMEVLATHADLVARRSSPIPADIAARLDELLAQHKTLAWAVPLSGAIQL